MTRDSNAAAREAAPRKTTNGAAIKVPLADRLSWSVDEFGALHGLSSATIYRRAAEGAIRLSKFGGRTLITKQAADAWLVRMAAGAPRPAA